MKTTASPLSDDEGGNQDPDDLNRVIDPEVI
jgi:hypothetical protein